MGEKSNMTWKIQEKWENIRIRGLWGGSRGLWGAWGMIKELYSSDTIGKQGKMLSAEKEERKKEKSDSQRSAARSKN